MKVQIAGDQLVCSLCGSRNLVLQSDTSVTRKLRRIENGGPIFDASREVDEDEWEDRLLCTGCRKAFPVRWKVEFE